MDEIDTLIARVERIFEDCGGPKAVNEEEEERHRLEVLGLNQDPIAETQRQVHQHVVECHRIIRQRNDTMVRTPDNKAKIAILNNQIRQETSIIENLKTKLEGLVEKKRENHMKLRSKGKGMDDGTFKIMIQQDNGLIELVERHIENLKQGLMRTPDNDELVAAAMGSAKVDEDGNIIQPERKSGPTLEEKKKDLFGMSSSDESDELFVNRTGVNGMGGGGNGVGAGVGGGGGGGGGGDGEMEVDVGGGINGEDIEPVGGYQLGIAIIKQQEKQIDEGLDIVERNVLEIKKRAEGIQEELELQETIINDTKDHMEAVDAEIRNQTTQMKKLVKKMGGCNKIIMRVVMIVIFLILIGLAVCFII